MAGMASPPPLNSPAAAPSGVFSDGSYYASLSVKSTILYIGLSLAVLLIILVLLTMTLFFCIRPGRRRREAIAAMQRQRAEGVQAAKTEEAAFVPQKRQYPVVVLQPYTSDVAYGRKVSMDKPDLPAVVPAAADPEDPERGETSAHGSSSAASQEQEHYNPLTHYMTERQPHYFIANLDA